MRTFKIELRVDYDDPEKDEIMREACRAACREMLATAHLISERDRQPRIALSSKDFFEADNDIDIMEGA